MKYTFKNGAKVEGTYDQIEKMAIALSEKIDTTKIDGIIAGYYKSETKGLVKITEMAEFHLRNALVKRGKEQLEILRKKKVDTKNFLKDFISLAEDKVVVELFTELAKRK